MTRHIPVLLKETIDLLALEADDVVFDGTVGTAGHSQAICTKLGVDGCLIGVDRDSQAIAQAQKTLADCDPTLCLHTTNFREIEQVVTDCGEGCVNKAVLDLGFRSEQLTAGRGLSFREEAPLLMTYKAPDDLTGQDVTAHEIVNEWGEENIAQILTGYANERHAGLIAEAIVRARKDGIIESTTDLVRIIKSAVPHYYRNGRRHPATRTFQALRMAVNDELRSLQDGMESIFSVLCEGGRLAIISFESVTDRAVKQYFRKLAEAGHGKLLTDGPITPQEAEVSFNARARSAKLRCIQKMSV